jgi:hypothetical protein
MRDISYNIFFILLKKLLVEKNLASPHVGAPVPILFGYM